MAANLSDTPKNLQARRQGLTEDLLQYVWANRPELADKATPTIQAALSALKREIDRADGLDGTDAVTAGSANAGSDSRAIDYF